MLRRVLRSFGFALVLLLSGAPASAQDGLQSPSQFLDYELGTQFTPHHRALDYVRHVAETAPGVRLTRYGTTYEGRPLVALYVTTPENLRRLDTLRTDNLKRAGLREGAPQAAPKALVWLSYNVHGDEAVGTEAALATLYALANPENERVQRWLQDAVVVLDPCLNPDGRARYVQWYKQVAGSAPDLRSESREHHPPWPGGRTNHYYFDLNRDWAWQTQRETRQRVQLYNQWLPHVHVDFHEQGVDDPYYFAPGARPFHESITDWQHAFQRTIGERNAQRFDEENWLYFTEEVFDLFYPSYGDTWPLFNGAIGMTYEQGGAGRAGLAIRTEEGDTLTLRERLRHHRATGLATVETAAQHHEQIVQRFRQYYERAAQETSGPYATYVVKGDAPSDRLAALTRFLDRQDIEYGYAARQRSAGGFSYATGERRSFTVAPGDLLISTRQPKSTLLKVLFEPRSTLTDSLTYDITAWALPYAYNLRAYATREALAPDRSAPPSRTPSRPRGEQSYAYLVEWQSTGAVRFLSVLLQQELRPRFTMRPLKVGDHRYGRGTLVLTRADNEHLGARFDRIVRQAADSLNQPLRASSTGFTEQGPDFGSADLRFLARPRVAVLSGPSLSANSTGSVWHYFDRQVHYPATLLRSDYFDPAELNEYDVLVLPSGSYGEVLSRKKRETLKRWIQAGGRLIALERAAEFLAGKEDFALRKKKSAPDTTRLRRYADRSRENLTEAVPGAIFRVRMDDTHPLGFGYGNDYYTLKRGSTAFRYLDDGWNVGVLPGGAHVSGFAGHEVQWRLDESLAFGVQEMGAGRVVYLADNPLFRGFWHAGKLLFGNAVFLVGQE